MINKFIIISNYENEDSIMNNYTDFNSKIIDGWVNEGWEWGKPISHKEFVEAQKGNFRMV